MALASSLFLQTFSHRSVESYCDEHLRQDVMNAQGESYQSVHVDVFRQLLVEPTDGTKEDNRIHCALLAGW